MPQSTPEPFANLVRRGQDISEASQVAFILFTFSIIFSVVIHTALAAVGLSGTLTIVLGTAAILAAAMFVVYRTRLLLDFRRENRAAYDAGQQKLNAVPRGKRFIWQTDHYGDPIGRQDHGQ
jgi:uncharacterized membrane protein YbhN (UPF0104 family)